MKKDLTELVFILDRSGSMSGHESDTIYGYNAMLESRKRNSARRWSIVIACNPKQYRRDIWWFSLVCLL